MAIVDELLALPLEERMKLGEILMDGAVPPDIGPLLRDLDVAIARDAKSLRGGILPHNGARFRGSGAVKRSG